MTDPRQQLRERLAEPPADDPRERLRARIQDPEGSTALGAFLVNLFKGTGDAVLSIPSASGDALAAAAAGVEGTARGVVPGGEGFEFSRRFREQQEQFPANVIRAIPRPTTNDLIAGERALIAAAGGQPIADAFSAERERLEAEDIQRSEDQPVASAFGDLGGDIAALFLAKRPMQTSIRNFERRLVSRSATRSSAEAGTLMRDVDRIFRSRGAQLAKRGLFRASETGLEAAFLEVLNDAQNDPFLVASIASGGQLVGSASAETLKGMTKIIPNHRLLSAGVSALSTMGLIQMLKSASPGGRDRILESAESGFDKATLAIVMGAVGAMVGGRGRGRDVSQITENLLDGLSTTARGGALSILSEWVGGSEEDQATIESTLKKVMADPNFEGEGEREREIVERLRQSLGTPTE